MQSNWTPRWTQRDHVLGFFQDFVNANSQAVRPISVIFMTVDWTWTLYNFYIFQVVALVPNNRQYCNFLTTHSLQLYINSETIIGLHMERSRYVDFSLKLFLLHLFNASGAILGARQGTKLGSFDTFWSVSLY